MFPYFKTILPACRNIPTFKLKLIKNKKFNNNKKNGKIIIVINKTKVRKLRHVRDSIRINNYD